ncbi:leucine-rich PPR motif-containing protein, mitochondrial [Monomorium pharaonis]|uniref:leucine-rich PPR motif-containing protein, mitochondrial n=1 Tax=Monomorium pharaonis TaxID=307658 RepID=UPI00063F1D3D|nr:leucine-rich PPR motif-containing protein, mitochondrial [Monomorium pharaonis]
MLYPRRHLTFIVRSQLRLLRCETTMNCLREMQRGGYVLGHMHLRHASLRPEIHIATCSRTYGTTVLQSSASDVDHKLMSFCDNVKEGRISADGLKEVIDLCNKNNYQLPHDTGVLLLKCCGNLLSDLNTVDRIYLADQVWHLIKKNGGTLTVEHYNTLLSVNKDNFRPTDPKKFLVNMSVEPDENTYRLLLNAATKVGNSEYLLDILSMIKDKNVVIYEEAINALIEICVTNNNITEVKQMITQMREAKLSTAKAYMELACGYAKLGDIPNLVMILNEEPQDNTNLLKIIKVLSMSNNSRHIPVVLNFLITSVPTLESEISKMIAELIRADRITEGNAIINCLALNEATKDMVRNVVNSFMTQLVLLNSPVNDIIKYANDFVESDCNQQALIDVAEIGLKLGREKLCFAIFEAMRNKNIELRPHYYWPLLIRAYHNKGESEIYSLIKSMMYAGVEIDSDTMLYYVFPYVNTANPIVTLNRLLLNNVPATFSCMPLLHYLLQQNRLRDITPLYTYPVYYKVYYKELIKPLVCAYLATKDAENCAILLTALPQGQDFIGLFLRLLVNVKYPTYTVEHLQLLIKEFKKREAKISLEDAIILKKELQMKTFNLTLDIENLIDGLVDSSIKISDSMLITLPKYLNTKELTYYLVELKNKKFSTKGVLQRLLFTYCNEHNLKKVKEIKREYDACQYEWTPNMKSSLFELYLWQNMLEEAETLLSDLQNMPDKFQLDRIKIVMYATMLVKTNNPAKAFNVIESFDISDTRVDAQAQCCTLLEVLAQSRYHALTADMLNLLLKKNYCQITANLLKPLVTIPLERDNIKDAIDVVAKCVEEYHMVPLAFELLTMLLEQKYSSKLQNTNEYIELVYNAVVTTTSIAVANTLLAIALATLNKTEKVQALLKDYELSTNCLVHYINTKSNKRVVDGFLNLLKIADVNHFNQDTICETLLAAYSKVGDCHRALQLWKIMCMKNIKPSEQFEKNFVALLLSNKIPLPSEFDCNKSKINISN